MRFTDSHQNRPYFDGEEVRRTAISLEHGWKYIPDDCISDKLKNIRYDAYGLTKTGAQASPAAMSYDDSQWQEISVPHDLTVGRQLDPAGRDYNGYLPQQSYWYRKFFRLKEEDREKRIVLHFEGVSGESRIWVNGVLMKEHHSSYCGIDLDITDVVGFESEVNLITVLSDNTRMQGWWYQGCGIYRKVWLEKTDLFYIGDDTVHIITRKKELEGSGWTVSVSCKVKARYGMLHGGTVSVYLRGPDGKTYLAGMGNVEEDSRESEQRIEFSVENPELWRIWHGRCYVLSLALETDGRICDRYEQAFGFREICFDAGKGFLLNGKPEKIRGFCFHEDEGNLGVAIDRSVYERRIKNLIGMGANAYRCSHNAPARELLELCDQYGILVMEETRKFSTDEKAMEELEWMVRRDRNHPCVILWSVGNEEPWQKEERGKRIAETMRGLIYRLDGERPVTMAVHNGFFETGAADSVDVLGVNYNHEILEQIRERYEDKPMLGTEVLSLADGVTECGNQAPGSQGACETLLFADTHDYYSGTFTWAGQDYRGEHRNLGFFTDACPLDINGGKKDAFYWYAAMWKEEPMVHICGHWNPDGKRRRKVTVYSSGQEVSLYLNGRLCGRQKTDQWHRAVFDVAYEEGELAAESVYQEKTMRHSVRTSKEAYSFRLRAEQTEYPADGETYITVWVEAVDREGVPAATASHIFSVETDGKTEIICTDNADPYCSAFPDKTEMCLYRGRGKIVLKAGCRPGKFVVTVSGMLRSANCTVHLSEPEKGEKTDFRTEEREKLCSSPYINDWFISHIFDEEPDIYEYTADDHYLYWRKSLERSLMLDKELPFYFSRQGGYVIYCMEPDMPELEPGKTGAIVFEEITGSAKVLISMRDYDNRIRKQFYYEKADCEGRSVRIGLPGVKTGDRLILKLVIFGNHAKCGITAPVRFET